MCCWGGVQEDIVIDAKSGVSGAGRSVKQAFLYTEIAEGMNAYGVSRHRHMPEIEQVRSLPTGRASVAIPLVTCCAGLRLWQAGYGEQRHRAAWATCPREARNRTKSQESGQAAVRPALAYIRRRGCSRAFWKVGQAWLGCHDGLLRRMRAGRGRLSGAHRRGWQRRDGKLHSAPHALQPRHGERLLRQAGGRQDRR